MLQPLKAKFAKKAAKKYNIMQPTTIGTYLMWGLKRFEATNKIGVKAINKWLTQKVSVINECHIEFSTSDGYVTKVDSAAGIEK